MMRGHLLAAAWFLVGVAHGGETCLGRTKYAPDFDLPARELQIKWTAGVDYIMLAEDKIKGGYVPDSLFRDVVPMSIPCGKVAVTYFFQYTWRPEFEKKLTSWASGHKDVVLVRRPSLGWAHTRIHARMYYTLEKIGRADDLHFKLYDWVWDDWNPESGWPRYRVYHGNPLLPDKLAIDRLNLEFARVHGIDERIFLAAYDSSEVSFQVELAAKESHTAGSGGNPGDASIVINGKYATSGTRVCHKEYQAGARQCADEHARLLELINDLVNDELVKERHLLLK